MLYNDEETRKKEEQFQKDLEFARTFTTGDFEKMKDIIIAIEEHLKPYMGRTDLTVEELAMIKDVGEKMKLMLKNTSFLKSIIEESLIRQSDQIYFGIKKKAENGDEEAIKAYEKLKPAYQAALKDEISDN